MNEHDVIQCAWEIHQARWRMSGNDSEGDNLASLITQAWQKRIKQAAPDRFAVEYRIAPHLKQRIDLVDLVDGIAYELKVSPNNVHMEFYRDIFKVMLARDNGMPNLKRFVFLTPETSAASLRKGMGGAVIRDSEVGLRLKIDVIGLGRSDAVPTAEELRLAKLADLEKQIDRLQKHLKDRLHTPGAT